VDQWIINSIRHRIATTTTTTTSVTTTLPAVQQVDPSELIRQCEQPVLIGTFVSTVGVGVASSIVYGVVFAKMAAALLKPPSLPALSR